MLGRRLNHRLRQASDPLQNLRVAGALFEIGFERKPADDASAVDDVSRWVRPSFAAGVVNTVPFDDFAAFVFEQGKVKVAGKSLFELLHELFGIVVAVYTDGEDLNLIFFRCS